MKPLIFFLALCLSFLSVNAEIITLYNDNGQGGIRKTTGKTLVIDGQYYVDIKIPQYNGKTKSERHKIYRVHENARMFYYQPKWAEKYAYVIESNARVPYYFNMKSTWKPSLTQDPNDPTVTLPQKKLTVMRQDLDGGSVPMKVLLVKSQGKYLLYTGDDCFGYAIEHNDGYNANAPGWTRKYKYKSNIGGWPVYFNISSK